MVCNDEILNTIAHFLLECLHVLSQRASLPRLDKFDSGPVCLVLVHSQNLR